MSDTITIEVEGKYFDLDAFEEVASTTVVDFTPADSLKDAMSRVGNEEKVVVDLINSALREQATRAARKEISAKGVGKDTVYKVARGFYDMPQFADMSRPERRTAVFNLMKSSPGILAAIREAAAEEPEPTGTDDDDD